MTLSVIGGVFGLLILAGAWFVWSAMGTASEKAEELEGAMSTAESHSRKAIYPSAESVKALDGIAGQYNAWTNEVMDLIVRGDRDVQPTTPAAFKEFLAKDAKRLAALPGGVAGRLLKAEFAFGAFKDFISGATMPPEAQLKKLQRQWEDLGAIMELLSAAGVAELVDFQCKSDEVKQEPVVPKAKSGSKYKAKARQQDQAEKPLGSCQTYRLVFNTRAAGFVKALNALETSTRFTVIDDFSFRHAKDAVAEALVGAKKDGEAKGSAAPRRRRGRRAAEQDEQEKSAEKTLAESGIVADPQLEEPFNVTLTVSVYDFGTLEEVKK